MIIKGLSVVITGGLTITGRTVAEELLIRQAKVVLIDDELSAGKAIEIVSELVNTYQPENVIFVPCSFTTKKEINDGFERAKRFLGGMDVLINAMGIIDEDDWENMMEVNVMGMIRCCYAALDNMSLLKGGSGGVIINTSTLAGLVASPLPAYCSSKHAIVGFSKSLPRVPEFNKHGIRINCVCLELNSSESAASIKCDNPAFTVAENAVANRLETFLKSVTPLSQFRAAEGYTQLIEDDTKSGTVMRITQDQGIEYQLQRKGSVR